MEPVAGAGWVAATIEAPLREDGIVFVLRRRTTKAGSRTAARTLWCSRTSAARTRTSARWSSSARKARRAEKRAEEGEAKPQVGKGFEEVRLGLRDDVCPSRPSGQRW